MALQQQLAEELSRHRLVECRSASCGACLLELSTHCWEESIAQRKREAGSDRSLRSHAQVRVALVDGCQHVFHASCIDVWAKVENSCPQCRTRFSMIAEYDLKSGKRCKCRHIEARDQVDWDSIDGPSASGESEGDDGVACDVCGSAGGAALLLLCDGRRGRCKGACHTFCDGLGRTVPTGAWFCQRCRPRECALEVRPSETAILRGAQAAPCLMNIGPSASSARGRRGGRGGRSGRQSDASRDGQTGRGSRRGRGNVSRQAASLLATRLQGDIEQQLMRREFGASAHGETSGDTVGAQEQMRSNAGVSLEVKCESAAIGSPQIKLQPELPDALCAWPRVPSHSAMSHATQVDPLLSAVKQEPGAVVAELSSEVPHQPQNLLSTTKAEPCAEDASQPKQALASPGPVVSTKGSPGDSSNGWAGDGSSPSISADKSTSSLAIQIKTESPLSQERPGAPPPRNRADHSIACGRTKFAFVLRSPEGGNGNRKHIDLDSDSVEEPSAVRATGSTPTPAVHNMTPQPSENANHTAVDFEKRAVPQHSPRNAADVVPEAPYADRQWFLLRLPPAFELWAERFRSIASTFLVCQRGLPGVARTAARLWRLSGAGEGMTAPRKGNGFKLGDDGPTGEPALRRLMPFCRDTLRLYWASDVDGIEHDPCSLRCLRSVRKQTLCVAYCGQGARMRHSDIVRGELQLRRRFLQYLKEGGSPDEPLPLSDLPVDGAAGFDTTSARASAAIKPTAVKAESSGVDSAGPHVAPPPVDVGAGLIEDLKQESWYKGQITHVSKTAPRSKKTATPRVTLDKRLYATLSEYLGVVGDQRAAPGSAKLQLYEHQAKAVDASVGQGG